MTPTKTKAILRRLADYWRHEEAQLCKQFGDVVLPQSMRARRIKDTEAIDAAVEMIERLEAAEKERDALRAKIVEMERQEPVAWARKLAMDLPSFGCVTDLKYRPSNMPESAYMPLYALPGAAPEPSESEARMRWLLRQIVHALPSRRDWLDPAIEREARIATTPEANHDPR